METLSIKNLITILKNGHFPYYSDEELKGILKIYDPSKSENTEEISIILKKIRGKNGHEGRKLCIQSLNKKEKIAFIHHLYRQSVLSLEKNIIKYN